MLASVGFLFLNWWVMEDSDKFYPFLSSISPFGFCVSIPAILFALEPNNDDALDDRSLGTKMISYVFYVIGTILGILNVLFDFGLI
jgi:hypothetical protein